MQRSPSDLEEAVGTKPARCGPLAAQIGAARAIQTDEIGLFYTSTHTPALMRAFAFAVSHCSALT